MLSTADLVTIWETGQDRHDADKALIILGCARPDLSWDELASLPLGQRDALLLQVRNGLFGGRLDIGVRCRRCGEGLEFDASIDELLPEGWLLASRPPVRVEVDGLVIEARPVCTRDLVQLGPRQTAAEGRGALLRACVLSARAGDEALDPAALPEPAIAGLADALTEADPLADIEFALVCPRCRHGWNLIFDITAFFWRELSVVAQSLLDDVYELADRLGWSQSEILALSPARRAYYLSRARG